MAININQFDLSGIKTVADLQNYLHTFPSPIAAQFILDAIQFFLERCVLESCKKDWKAIKERKRMGMKCKLEEEDRLTKEICNALAFHTVHPYYGRKKADHNTYLTSAFAFGDDNPVITAGAVLRKLAELNS